MATVHELTARVKSMEAKLDKMQGIVEQLRLQVRELQQKQPAPHSEFQIGEGSDTEKEHLDAVVGREGDCCDVREVAECTSPESVNKDEIYWCPPSAPLAQESATESDDSTGSQSV
ncbi:uncharacterized protein [Periplaneta americana]|uniref:uncharacterized protein n=1 Tax=Periplaneta americana TaxID=6978 RepID=UPI0037E8959A